MSPSARITACVALLIAWLLFPAPVALAATEKARQTTLSYSHFLADDLPGETGYTWTLPSRLGSLLADLESRYGPRDRDYTILGVEFGGDIPQVWYPGNRKQVIVQLARNALLNERLAAYQLAHEAVHLLAPTGKGGTTVIEEGLATMYAEDFVSRTFGIADATNSESYRDAARLVRRLMKIDPDCIARLRRSNPTFATWRSSNLAASCPTVPDELSRALSEQFSR